MQAPRLGLIVVAGWYLALGVHAARALQARRQRGGGKRPERRKPSVFDENLR